MAEQSRREFLAATAAFGAAGLVQLPIDRAMELTVQRYQTRR